MADTIEAAGEAWQPLHPREASDLLAGVRAPWWIAGGWAIDLFLGRQSRPHKDLDVGILRTDVAEIFGALPGRELFEAKDGLLSRLDAGAAPRSSANGLWGRPVGSRHWVLEFLLNDSVGASAAATVGASAAATVGASAAATVGASAAATVGASAAATAGASAAATVGASAAATVGASAAAAVVAAALPRDARGATSGVGARVASAADRLVFRRTPSIGLPMSTAVRHSDDDARIPHLAPEFQLLYKSRHFRPQDEIDFSLAAPHLNLTALCWLREKLTITAPTHPWLHHAHLARST